MFLNEIHIFVSKMNINVFRITTHKYVNSNAVCEHVCGENCAIHSYLKQKTVQQFFLDNNELICFKVFQHRVFTNAEFQQIMNAYRSVC